MRKIKYYIAGFILLAFSYWWFGYGEMSFVGEYKTEYNSEVKVRKILVIVVMGIAQNIKRLVVISFV